MTPMASLFVQGALTTGRKSELAPIFLPMLSELRCFDIEAIYNSVNQALGDLRGTELGETADYLFENHVLPSPMVWLEARTQSFTVISLENTLQFSALRRHTVNRMKLVPFASAGLHKDEEGRWIITPVEDLNEADALALIMFTLLLIDFINQPYVCRSENNHPHRALARKVRGAGLGELRPWHVITLRPRSGEVQGGEGHHSPKCFHFVRGHKRHYRNGRVSKVTHHWRGDPALGISRANYKVLPNSKVPA